MFSKWILRSAIGISLGISASPFPTHSFAQHPTSPKNAEISKIEVPRVASRVATPATAMRRVPLHGTVTTVKTSAAASSGKQDWGLRWRTSDQAETPKLSHQREAKNRLPNPAQNLPNAQPVLIQSDGQNANQADRSNTTLQVANQVPQLRRVDHQTVARVNWLGSPERTSQLGSPSAGVNSASDADPTRHPTDPFQEPTLTNPTREVTLSAPNMTSPDHEVTLNHPGEQSKPPSVMPSSGSPQAGDGPTPRVLDLPGNRLPGNRSPGNLSPGNLSPPSHNHLMNRSQDDHRIQARILPSSDPESDLRLAELPQAPRSQPPPLTLPTDDDISDGNNQNPFPSQSKSTTQKNNAKALEADAEDSKESVTRYGQGTDYFNQGTFSCEEFRSRIASQTIDQISLDVSPPFRPDEFDQRRHEELRNDFAEKQSYRQWSDVQGNELASGRLLDLAYEKAIVETEDGRNVELAINQLSEGDLAYITSNWGLPRECRIEQVAYQPRQWTPSKVTWKASNLCHNPLYFQSVNLERYGHTRGPLVEPVVQSAYFFGNLFILPYKMGVHSPSERQYALGYYRPGNEAPWIQPPLPISARGALAQAATVSGLFWLIP